jgi:hypothetical protein
MKKQVALTTIKAQNKNGTKPARHLSNTKCQRYIYTEADLGEGILDEGVSQSYSTNQKYNTLQGANAIVYTMEAIGNKTIRMDVPNVEEDFSYTYYCR